MFDLCLTNLQYYNSSFAIYLQLHRLGDYIEWFSEPLQILGLLVAGVVTAAIYLAWSSQNSAPPTSGSKFPVGSLSCHTWDQNSVIVAVNHNPYWFL